MSKSSQKIQLTSVQWDELRRIHLDVQAVPIWAKEVFSLDFEQVQSLPTCVGKFSASRPIIHLHDRRSYLSILERIRYGSDSSDLEIKRCVQVAALKEHPCQRIYELQIFTSAALFRSLIAETSNEIIHMDTLPGHFVAFPKWQQMLV